MKKNLFKPLMMVLTIFSPSCKEIVAPDGLDEEFRYIGITCDGIDLTRGRSARYGRIPASGAEFTVIPEEKYADIAFVGMLDVWLEGDKDYIFHRDWNVPKECPEIFEEWGEITYDSSTKPHTIRFKINTNEKDVTRHFMIHIGAIFDSVRIYLDQAPKPDDGGESAG